MRMKRMSVNVIVLAALLLSVIILPVSAQAKPPCPSGSQANSVTCNLPESNAEALEILSNYYPGSKSSLLIQPLTHLRANL